MIGIKITDLPSNSTIKETDQFVLARGRTTRRVSGGTFLVGIEQVERYIVSFNELLTDTIHVKDSPTINLFYDSTSRTLSGEFAGSSLLSPQKPLLYTQSITAVDAFHNRVVALSSYLDLTICLPNVAPGITISFLRAGSGEVTFTAGVSAELRTSPDPTYINIADQYSFVTAYHMQDGQWFLNGSTASLSGGYLLLDGIQTPIQVTHITSMNGNNHITTFAGYNLTTIN